MPSIQSRIQAVFVVMMGIIIVEGWFGLDSLNTLQDRMQQTADRLIPLNRVVSRLESMQTQQHNQFAKAMPDAGSPDQMLLNPRILHDQIQRMTRELDRGLEIVQDLGHDRNLHVDERDLERLTEHMRTIRNQQQEIDTLIDQALVVREGSNARLSLTDTRRLIDTTELLEIEVDDLLEGTQELLAAIMSHTLAVREQAVGRMIAILVFSLILGVVLMLHITRSILRPLSIAHRMAEQISRGELKLTRPPEAETKDEFGKLLATLNEMSTELLKHRQAENRLLQSEKISSLGRLAIGLAHEINNPLANALMHLELLRLTLEGCHESFQERLASIERNVSKAIAIAKDLLNFSRPEPPAFSLLHLHDSIECVLSLLDHRLREIQVQRNFAPDLPRIHGIGGKLEQVFMNLIKNAVEAMPHGGTLVIVTHATSDALEVTIRDSGPGIPLALRGKVLETFFTTRHEEGGVGLGLTVCQGILTQHGGTLILDDAPEGGLAALVRLPRHFPDRLYDTEEAA